VALGENRNSRRRRRRHKRRALNWRRWRGETEVEEKEEIGMKGVGVWEVNGCGHESVKVSLVAMIM